MSIIRTLLPMMTILVLPITLMYLPKTKHRIKRINILNENGFSLLFVLKFLLFLVIISFVLAGINTYKNSAGYTEKRAYSGAQLFIEKNNLTDRVERLTCAKDSDGDGYGTCTVKLAGENPIRLECPTNWLDVKMGATSCKEVFFTYNMMTPTQQEAKE